jgi:Fe-S-cluster containining protein
MSDKRFDEKYFADICIDRCGGKCCAPWWGVVSYAVKKENGLSRLNDFRKELGRGLKEREERIIENYVTSEDPPRRLFDRPDRYNLVIEKVDVSGTTLLITVRAMFAFSCRFFTNDRLCGIHPSITGKADVRPPHCGYMGSPNARYGEKGFCRIIHASLETDEEKVARAIETERASSKTHHDEGFSTPEEAVDKAIGFITDYCRQNAPQLFPREGAAQKVGRNDPCPCGSGKKYKKCHAS